MEIARAVNRVRGPSRSGREQVVSEFARRIVVVGTGYVGLTTDACLASLGHRVVCADVDEAKVERLRAGQINIREPGLAKMVAETMAAGRLSFVVGAATALDELEREGAPVEVLFVCVPTPIGVGGLADLSTVQAVIDEVPAALPAGAIVVNKSSVPVGAAERTAELLERPDVNVVSKSEFLREGSGVYDFLNPDRISVGADAQDAAERVVALWARLGAPMVLTDWASAEMIKYAANCFLVMKLSYVNAIAELCERLDADVADVTEGLGFDKRIGQAFLSPGPGWGGSCLPKDTSALLQLSASVDFEFRLLRATIETNTRQSQQMVEKIRLAVYGPRQRPDMAFTRFCRAVAEGEQIQVFGSGDQVRDFTYVDDVVEANIRASTAPVGNGAVFNVAGGTSTTVNEVLDLLGEIPGREVRVARAPPCWVTCCARGQHGRDPRCHRLDARRTGVPRPGGAVPVGDDGLRRRGRSARCCRRP